MLSLLCGNCNGDQSTRAFAQFISDSLSEGMEAHAARSRDAEAKSQASC